ncbi:MAG: replication protein [Candidatus Paceibacterota bacterium]
MKKEKVYTDFPGFSRYYHKNFFIYPHVLEDYWHIMSGSEQKVMDFILRRTIGWRKTADSISLGQFQSGVRGRYKNTGTGLSVSQIRRAIKGLEEKGFIRVIRVKRRPSTFELVMEKTEWDRINEKAFDAFKEIKKWKA